MLMPGLTAAEAATLNPVAEVVPDGKLDERALDLARRLAEGRHRRRPDRDPGARRRDRGRQPAAGLRLARPVRDKVYGGRAAVAPAVAVAAATYGGT
jgi:enoyl-CoA hydratase/carnithine racemase